METPLFGLSKLNEVSKGNDAFVKKMLVIFCEQTPQLIEEIEKAFAANDLVQVAKVAHQLKPSINGLEIISLSATISYLEMPPDELTNTSEVKKRLALLNHIISEVIKKIKTDHLSA